MTPGCTRRELRTVVPGPNALPLSGRGWRFAHVAPTWVQPHREGMRENEPTATPAPLVCDVCVAVAG